MDNSNLGLGFILGTIIAVVVFIIVFFSVPPRVEVFEKYIIEIGCATYASDKFVIKDECKKYYGAEK
jgi:hypothetical protein